MIFYSVIGSDGREVLVTTQVEAKAINRDYTQVEVPTDKPGLQQFIQQLMDAAQMKPETLAGVDALPTSPPLPVSTEPKQPDYSDWSMAIEDNWAKLPLSMQLHFAALAMENARNALPKTD